MNRDVDYSTGKVILKPYEIEMAKFVAGRRIEESRRLKIKDSIPNLSEERNISINTLGALGEVAVAKYLNQFWGGTVNTFHNRSDVGFEIEVRTTANDNQSLIIRKRDDPKKFYFLVLQVSESEYKIKGFILGEDGMKHVFYRSPNGREKAYFVPVEELNSGFESLRWDNLVI